MTMYYLGILLSSHLLAGILGMIICSLFYREEITEAIEENDPELDDIPIEINRKNLNIVMLLGGWFTLLTTLKSMFDYYFEPDDEC